MVCIIQTKQAFLKHLSENIFHFILVHTYLQHVYL